MSSNHYSSFEPARTPAAHAAALGAMLVAARERTRALVADLDGAQLMGPCLAIVNPPLWEIGHLAWFQERWCLRRLSAVDLAPSLLPEADRLYDSATVSHATRWTLPLPALEDTLAYMDAVLGRVLGRLQSPAHQDDGLAYFAQLAALHEEMHCEALTYTRQTLGYRTPRVAACAVPPPAVDPPGADDVEIAGGVFRIGADPDTGFVFDNEKWAHPVHIAAFRIARRAVSNAEFAAFVDDEGYGRAVLWSPEGWSWRCARSAQQPAYWLRQDGRWYERRYDAVSPIVPDAPVMHVNRYEAEAWCRWAGRRLPTEAEWESAAATAPGATSDKRRQPWGDALPDPTLANVYGGYGAPVAVSAYPAGDSGWGCRQLTGNVWEWTASPFAPYPGFVADPYREYSQPWFGTHAVLRGGSFATRGHLLRNTWRNFYTPDRRDIFAGFRTCA